MALLTSSQAFELEASLQHLATDAQISTSWYILKGNLDSAGVSCGLRCWTVQDPPASYYHASEDREWRINGEIAEKTCHQTCTSIPKLLFLFLKGNSRTVVSPSSFSTAYLSSRHSDTVKKKRLYETSFVASNKALGQAWNVTFKMPRRPLLNTTFPFLC